MKLPDQRPGIPTFCHHLHRKCVVVTTMNGERRCSVCGLYHNKKVQKGAK